MQSKHSLLVDILKHKGIGPAGSKSLSKVQAENALDYLTDIKLNTITQLTLLTALMTLDKNEHENQLLELLKTKEIKAVISRFLLNTPENRFEELILKVIGRQDLSQEESDEAISLFFNCSSEPLKASFLEAERLKRETTLENLSFLNFFWKKVHRQKYIGGDLLDFCNNYDGWKRTANFSTITAIFLAYCGIPTLTHGLEIVAPKYGYTSKKVLEKFNSERLPKQFNYIDQSKFFPELYALKQLRSDMVKRPFLATLEKLLQPIRANGGNMLIIGYTHKAYKDELTRLMLKQNKAKSTVIIKGEEGSTQLPLNKETAYTLMNKGQIIEGVISPQEFGIDPTDKPREKNINEEFIYNALSKKNQSEYSYAIKLILYNAKAFEKIFNLKPNKSLSITNLESLLETLVVS